MAVSLRSPGPQFDFGRGSHWLHESPFLPVLWEQTQDLGAPSLKHAAMKRLLSDQSLLTVELFAQVPWHIAKYLWECLGQCNKQTLHMWMIMAKVYPRHFPQLSPSYSLHVEQPQEPLKLYIDMMNGESCHWRGVLYLSASHATITDLVAIGNMTNLIGMEIFTHPLRSTKIGGSSDPSKGLGLDDRIIRSWVEAAESVGSLQQLRVLFIADQANLTIQALRMLEKLPQLELIVAYQCDALNENLEEYPGWRDNGVLVEGWTVHRRKLLECDRDAETVALNRRLLALLGIFDTPLPEEINSHKDLDQGQGTYKQPGEEHRPFCPGSGSPVMRFQLSTDPPTMDSKLVRAVHGGQPHILFLRAPPRERKRALSESVPASKGKRIMKDRGGRDMADILGDFL